MTHAQLCSTSVDQSEFSMEARGSGTPGEEGAGQRDRVSLASSSSGRYGSIAGGLAKSTTPLVGDAALSTRRSYLAVAVLCYLNLLNFMDRYTIAGQPPPTGPHTRWAGTVFSILDQGRPDPFMLL